MSLPGTIHPSPEPPESICWSLSQLLLGKGGTCPPRVASFSKGHTRDKFESSITYAACLWEEAGALKENPHSKVSAGIWTWEPPGRPYTWNHQPKCAAHDELSWHDWNLMRSSQEWRTKSILKRKLEHKYLTNVWLNKKKENSGFTSAQIKNLLLILRKTHHYWKKSLKILTVKVPMRP